ncbi:MAG: hypothetical protein H6631_04020 [Anaerolineaceae bacterium]|nr:hypothetical protein [Anaerolineaceae bacterium]
MTANNSGQFSNQGSGQAANEGEKLTPELVEVIAAKVYALMLRDLKIERERRRWPINRPFSRGG